MDLIDFEDLRDMNPDVAIEIVLAKQALEKADEAKTAPITLRTVKQDVALPGNERFPVVLTCLDLKIPPLGH